MRGMSGRVCGEALVEDGAEVAGSLVAKGSGKADGMADVGGDVAGEIGGVTCGDDDEIRGALELSEEATEDLGGDPVVGSTRALEDEDPATITAPSEVENPRREVVEAVEEVVERDGVDTAEIVVITVARALEGVFDRAGLLVEEEAGVGVGGVGGGEENRGA